MSDFELITPANMGGGKATSLLVQDDATLVVRHEQNIDALLEQNAAERDNNSMRYAKRPDSGMRKIASIPNVIVEDLMARGIWGNKERFKKWLNDPDNAVFRTHGGRV